HGAEFGAGRHEPRLSAHGVLLRPVDAARGAAQGRAGDLAVPARLPPGPAGARRLRGGARRAGLAASAGPGELHGGAPRGGSAALPAGRGPHLRLSAARPAGARVRPHGGTVRPNALPERPYNRYLRRIRSGTPQEVRSVNESASPERAGRSRDAPRLRWEPLVHIVYLFNLFFQPLFDPAPTLLVWLSIPVSIAVFLPLYVRGVSAPPAGRIRAALAVTAVGLATSFVNTGAAVYYVYAAALFGTALRGARLRWALAGLALLLVVQGLAVTTLVFRSPYPGISFVFCLVFVLVVGALTWSDAERERAHARLRLAQ